MVTRLVLTESLKAQRWAVPEGRNLNMCVKETSRDKAELLTELSHKNKVHRSWKQRQKSKAYCLGVWGWNWERQSSAGVRTISEKVVEPCYTREMVMTGKIQHDSLWANCAQLSQ